VIEDTVAQQQNALRNETLIFSETGLQIQSPEALQMLGLAIQNRQSKIQN
jgi:hypothetical protein